MGSLFDGIGGFPLAAVRNGIEPLWASEIEAFPNNGQKIFRGKQKKLFAALKFCHQVLFADARSRVPQKRHEDLQVSKVNAV